MVGTLQPLTQQVPIINPDGTPTNYFITWAQQRQMDISGSVDESTVNQLINVWSASRKIIAGTGLNGGGLLSSDVTINSDGVTVQLNGVDVAENVFTINFTGSGVTVTETAPGVVDVDITGGAPPVGGHIYWRVTVNMTEAGGFPAMGGIQIRPVAGTPNPAIGGTPTVSSVLFGSASGAWNATDATGWVSNGAAPQWAKYQFATAVSCAELALTSSATFFANEGAENFVLEFSDDDITYTTAKIVTGEPPWTAAETRLYSVP